METRERKGVLLVTFGSALPHMQVVYETLAHTVGRWLPGSEVRWAFTSKRIRQRLADKGLKELDSPEMALLRMREDGFSTVGVLSFHVIPGEEFHELKYNLSILGSLGRRPSPIPLARPLLSDHETMVRVARILMGRLGWSGAEGKGLLLMGHGSKKHPANAVYAAMNQVFQDLGTNVLVGTLEAYPRLEDLLPRLKRNGVREVLLAPLMAAAGKHVMEDMAGNHPLSWSSILKQEGFLTEVNTSGMMEYPELVEIWLEHLRDAVKRPTETGE